MAKMNVNKSSDKVTYKDPRDAHSGTKPDMVVKETELPISMFFNFDSNSPAVIAEDATGFYISCKKFVSNTVLDPFRMYYRNNVNVTKNDGEEITYNITTPNISLVI